MRSKFFPKHLISLPIYRVSASRNGLPGSLSQLDATTSVLIASFLMFAAERSPVP